MACKSVMIDGVEYIPVPDTSDNIIAIKGVTYVRMYPNREKCTCPVIDWVYRPGEHWSIPIKQYDGTL